MGSSETDETLESHGAEFSERTSSLIQVREWVLVDGDRLLIATLLSIGVFVLFVGLNWLGIASFVNDDSITRLASGMVAGTFSLVTLVVSINQLILSQEFSPADQARSRLEGVTDFREEVAHTAMVPATPASPTRLLELIVESIHHRADDLADAVAEHDDPEVKDLILRYTNSVRESTERIDETLEHTKFGTFDAMSAAVAYDDAWQLYVARQLRGHYQESLSDEAETALDELIDALELFSVSREHFKTTYLQRELTRFSQLTIYTGVPSIVAAMTIILLYADLGGPSISIELLPYVVSALTAIVIAPLTLLVSYILRTATVTRRTTSIGPMLPEKDPEAGPFEVSYGDDADRARGTETD